MSSQGEPDTAQLARDSERAALAKAAAELEAEREAMRAELAAIEEEERLEAERIQQAAKATQSRSSGSSSRFLRRNLRMVAPSLLIGQALTY